MKSHFLKLNIKDIKRGVGLSFTAAFTYLLALMVAGKMPDAEILKSTLAVLLGSGGSYILKNFLTNSNDEFLKDEKGRDV